MLNEKIYRINTDYDRDIDTFNALCHAFFTEVLPTVWDPVIWDETNQVYWLDVEQTVGFCCETTSSGSFCKIWVKGKYGEIPNIGQYDSYSYLAESSSLYKNWYEFHYQVSKDHDVLYLRCSQWYNSNSYYSPWTYVVAVDEMGKTRAFIGTTSSYISYLTDPINGKVISGYNLYNASDINVPFIVQNVVGPDAVRFPNLYAPIYAPSANTLHPTLLSIDGEPYSLVSIFSYGTTMLTGSPSSNNTFASFAFPVSTAPD